MVLTLKHENGLSIAIGSQGNNIYFYIEDYCRGSLLTVEAQSALHVFPIPLPSPSDAVP